MVGLLGLSVPPVGYGAEVYLTEFMAGNSSTLTNEFEETEDWIELYNDSAQDVNLDGWYLTDSATQLTKWNFPPVILGSNQYLVVWASGRDTVLNGEIHTSFKLRSDGEYLALVRPDGTSVEHEYAPLFPDQKSDISYGLYFVSIGDEVSLSPSQADCRYHIPTGDIGTAWRSSVFDDTTWLDGVTGIGYENGSNSFFSDEINTDVASLMYSNMASVYIRIPFAVEDPAEFDEIVVDMRYDDGFAAYLNGVAISSDNLPTNQTASTLDWNAAAQLDRAESAAVIMTNIFRTTTPDTFFAAGTNMLVIHGLNVGITNDDILVQARVTGTLTGGFQITEKRYFAVPTPGTANTGSAVDFVEDTEFSVDRGFYTNAFDLTITTDTPDATIRYTLDGSTPTDVSGWVYSGPVSITSTTTVVRAAAFRSGWQPSDVDTQTYIFPAAVIQQPEQPAGWPTNWTGDYVDYEMDPNIVTSAAYASEFPATLLQIPTLSIVTDQQHLFGPAGIYDNPTLEGVTWERPSSAELIYPDGTKGFQVNCGLRIQGGASRTPANSPKHSLRLLFKDAYGPSKLRYGLFDDSAVDEFDTITLRAGYNYSWIHSMWREREKAQYTRDLFARRIQSAMGHTASHGRMFHLYLNGLYWGVYNASERPTAGFTSAYLGGEKENWDTVNSGEFKDGDSDAWDQMVDIAEDGLTNSVDYEAFRQYCDVTNLADYMIINHYIGNIDWDSKNWYAARRRRAGEGYQFFCWDSEKSVIEIDEDRTDDINGAPTKLFNEALGNAEFRLLFADRLHKHLFNDGALTPTNAAMIWDDISDVLDDVVVAESARWGDFHISDSPFELYTVNDHYLPEQNRILNQYLPVRTGILFSQYTGLGLYPGLAAPEFDMHGGMFTDYTTVNLSGPTNIYYTLDGSDPREYGTGSIQGASLTGPISLEHSSRVKARCYDGLTWSALTEADFHDLAPPALRVTEIMHSPRTPDSSESLVNSDASAYQFIELYNGGSETVGLLGVKFVNGIRFDFSRSSLLTLAPGEYVVIVKDRPAFLTRYPSLESQVAGEFLDALSGGGEGLAAESHGVGTILSFTYNDARDWPVAAAGSGHSLVPVNAETMPDEMLNYGRNWRASRAVDGSPGMADSGPVLTQLFINEVAGHTDFNDGDYPEYDSNDWIELYNAEGLPVSLNEHYLSDNPDDLLKWRIPDGQLLPAFSFISFDEITGFHAPITNGFGINKAGEQLFLSYAPSGTLARVVDAIEFKGQENGITIGRVPDGQPYWVATIATRNTNNLSVLPHPVISEIMYYPLDNGGINENRDLEFVEIYNPSLTAVSLWTMDGAEVLESWRLNGDISYTFPASTQLSAESRVLLLPFDPAEPLPLGDFLSRYDVPPATVLFGPYEGKLSNQSGRLTLEKPQAPDAIDEDVSWIIVDELTFSDASPWMSSADGLGYGLHRVLVQEAAADPESWADAVPSPGSEALIQPDLGITGSGVVLDQFQLIFDLLPDVEYTLESSTNLFDNSWFWRATLLNQGDFLAPIPAESGAEFYRLKRK